MKNKLETSELDKNLLGSIMLELENKNRETYDSVLKKNIKFSNVFIF